MKKFLVTGIGFAISASAAFADPPPIPALPEVFCFRITDIERVDLGDGSPDNDFVFEFEVLNWTDTPSGGVNIAATAATLASTNAGFAPTLVGIGIDSDGRGGDTDTPDEVDASGVGLTTGSGNFDDPAIHSGRGRGDIPGLENDWSPSTFTDTSAQWDVGAGTLIPNFDLVGRQAAGLDPADLVPGVPPALDALGDSAVDGGPAPFSPVPLPNGGSGPIPAGSGNVLDGFTMTIGDWDVDEVFSFNWNLLDGAGAPIAVSTAAGVVGNGYGLGVVNLVRIDPGAALPGPIFVGNQGFQNAAAPFLFFDEVFALPNPAEFGAEFGGGIIAPFANPNDNVFDQVPNTSAVPLPASGLLYLMAVGAVVPFRRRIWRKPRK